MARIKRYDVGNYPPQVTWTFVKGDSASFRVYVTDDAKQPLNIPDWDIEMEIARPNNPEDLGVITDDATVILTLYPAPGPGDGPGEFTVTLTPADSALLQTGDIFDIELTEPLDNIVWTVAQGSLIVLEDVTNSV